VTPTFPTRAESGAPWVEVLASLVQHRALTAAQVHAMHLPEARLRQAQRLLAALGREGLADRAVGLRAQRVWFATAKGIETVRRVGVLEGEPPQLDRRSAAGRLMSHTLAVNDVGIAFMAGARERGEGFGALSWRHEVYHPLSVGRGRRREAKIADAVLTHLRSEGTETVVEQRFCELDRATRSAEGLARELALYGRLRTAPGADGRPLWRERYPAFPSVLCVLAGARADILRRRRGAVLAFLAADPALGSPPRPPIRLCLLEELCAEGPYVSIFEEAGSGGAVDWLGREGGEP
jgi:Replication-relaxation